jgi:hypothetical protein
MLARLVSLFCLTVFQIFAAGPFGFEYGMTKEQVIAAVGQNAVRKATDDALEITTVPKPHPAFESYVLIISPTRGLVKIVAVGNTIKTNGLGGEVRDAFTETQVLVARNYGSPEKAFDFLRSGSIWNDPQDWMMGLAKKERVLTSFWAFVNSPNHITTMKLEAKALSAEAGYLALGYEFEGFEEYADFKTANAGKVF